MSYCLSTYRRLREYRSPRDAYFASLYAAQPIRTARRIRPEQSEAGRALRVAIASEDADGMLDALRNLPTRAHSSGLLDLCGCAVCEDCSEVFHSDDINRHGVCEGCEENYSECEHCGSRTTDGLRDIDGEACCDDCTDSAYYWEGDGEYHWEPEPEEEPDELPSYGTHGRLCRRLAGEPLPGLTDVGIELEVVGESGRETELAEAVCRSTDLVCGVESDGSLDDGGAEIVTHYGPLPIVVEKIGPLCRAVRRFRARSHDTDCCGLHVSLSCGGVSTYDLCKFVVFWNCQQNAAFLRVFARRWGAFYAAPKPEKKGALPPESDSAAIAEVLCEDDRRELVNLQERRKGRLEIRAFRGSTRAETVRACVELTVFAFAFCRSEPPRLHWVDFLRFVRTHEHAAHAQNLLSYWTSRKTADQTEDC